jgi:hypothetical protein
MPRDIFQNRLKRADADGPVIWNGYVVFHADSGRQRDV